MSKHSLLLALLTLGLIGSVAFGHIMYDKPACAISLNKLNTLYIGIENPLSIVVRGVPKDQLSIQGEGINLVKISGDNDDYTATASAPGIGYIHVSGGDLSPKKVAFRLKRIPNPVPTLSGTRRGGTIGNGEIKAQGGVVAVLENFDFDAYCSISSYEVTYLAKGQDPVTVTNTGARFSGPATDLVNRATPGDVYFFDDIRCQCPGDASTRNLGSLVFRIR